MTNQKQCTCNTESDIGHLLECPLAPQDMNKNWKKEEWGGWIIVSDMLEHPIANGVYGTSECYQRLYKFVLAQKAEVHNKIKNDLLAIADKGEYEELRREVSNYFAKNL